MRHQGILLLWWFGAVAASEPWLPALCPLVSPPNPYSLTVHLTVVDRPEFDAYRASISKQPFGVRLNDDTEGTAHFRGGQVRISTLDAEEGGTRVWPISLWSCVHAHVLRIRAEGTERRYCKPDKTGATSTTSHVQSMLCHRKSMAVKLQGEPLPLLPCVNTTRFHLVSLCQDAGYFKTTLGLAVYRELGLFPLQFRFVTTRVDEQPWGLYLQVRHHSLSRAKERYQPVHFLAERASRLQVEQPQDGIARYQAAPVRSLLRRGNDLTPDQVLPSIEWRREKLLGSGVRGASPLWATLPPAGGQHSGPSVRGATGA